MSGWRDQQSSLPLFEDRAGNRGILGGIIVAIGLAYSAPLFAADEIRPAELIRLLPSPGASFDNFGATVAIDGDVAVIGASGDDDQATDAGAAYVYHRVEDTWVQAQKIYAGDADEDDGFGTAVAVNGNTIIVGAYASNNGNFFTGSAYVFTRNGNTWTERIELVASDADFRDIFGSSIAIDGDTAVIGAPGVLGNGRTGKVYVFTGSGANWTEETILTADDGANDDVFGISVDMAADTVVVGARFDDDLGPDSGSAYVYVKTPQGWIEEDKLVAPDGANGDRFGSGVAIAGDRVLVGAPNHDLPETVTGAGYLFTRDNGSWSFEEKLEGESPGESAGTSVALTSSTAILGARFADAARVFRRFGDVWESAGSVVPGTGGKSTFATAIAYDGLRLVGGAFGDDDFGTRSGSASIFVVDVFGGIDSTDQGAEEGPAAAFTDTGTARARYISVAGADGSSQTDRTFGSASLWPADFLALPDLDLDGIAEFGLIVRDPEADEVQALIRDGATGLFEGKILFSSGYRVLNAILLAGTGGPGTWGLGVHGVTSGGSQRVQVKDLSTGALVSNVNFSGKYVPFGAAAIADYNDNDVDDIVVLSTQTGSRSLVQVKDGLTRQSLRIMYFSSQFEPVDFGVVPDVDGGGEPEVAVLGRNTSNDEVRLLLKDSVTSVLVKNRRFDSAYAPVAYVYVPDAGTGPAIGVLGRAVDDKVRLTLQDAVSGAFLRHISYNKNFEPRDVVVVPDSDASGADEIAVLGIDVTGQAHLQMKDSGTGLNVVDRDLP